MTTTQRSRAEHYDVFVAHSSDVKEFSERLANRLATTDPPFAPGTKLKVFFDSHEMGAGTGFDATIESAVITCRLFLFVISQESVADKSYARAELHWAKKARRPIYAIHADGHDRVRPPPLLDGILPISTEGNRLAQAVTTVLRELEALPKQSTPSRSLRNWSGAAALVLVSGLALGAFFKREQPSSQPAPRPSSAAAPSYAPLPIPSERPEPVPSGMARIGGATLSLGVKDAAAFKAWCERQHATLSVCEEALQRMRPQTLSVRSFDIDLREVAADEFAQWISVKLRDRAVTLTQGNLQRSSDAAPLWTPTCAGIGAYEIVRGEVRQRASDLPFDPRQAVSCVSAAAAAWYCSDQSKRLPTEAEWELAAGGASKRWLPWDPTGTEIANCSDAVFDRVRSGACERSLHMPASVDTPNRDVTPENVRNLGGNVSEWVSTDRSDAPFIAKGGSWGGLAIDLHPAKLMFVDPNNVKATTVGFRCARTLDTARNGTE